MWRKPSRLRVWAGKNKIDVTLPSTNEKEKSEESFTAELKRATDVIALLFNSRTYALALVIGGSIVIYYHYLIGHSIDLKIEDLAWVFVAAFVVGVCIIAVLFFALVFPGLLLGEANKNIRTQQSYGKQKISGINETILQLLIVPFAMFFITFVTCVLEIYLLLHESETHEVIQSIIAIGAIYLWIFFLGRYRIRAGWLNIDLTVSAQKFYVIEQVFPIILASFFACLSFIVILPRMDTGDPLGRVVLAVLFVILAAAITITFGTRNTSAIGSSERYAWCGKVVFLLVCVLFLLLLITDIGEKISFQVAKLTGIRSDVPMTYLLDEKGIKIVQAMEESDCYCTATLNEYRHAIRLSGLGNDYVLKCASSGGGYKNNFTLPKSAVLSVWAEEGEKAQPKSPSS